MIPDAQPVLSRHRLPRRYRAALIILWSLPLGLLLLALIISRGPSLALLDPRLLLPALLMLLPAWYVWQEGVDVLPRGIVARVHRPRFYDYTHLCGWRYDARPERRVLTIWDCEHRIVLECRATHLTEFAALLANLERGIARQGEGCETPTDDAAVR